MLTMKQSIFCATVLGATLAMPSFLAAQTKLTGAGASFPDPLYTKWTHEYLKARPDVQINYSGTGTDHRREGRWSSGPSGGQRQD